MSLSREKAAFAGEVEGRQTAALPVKGYVYFI